MRRLQDSCPDWAPLLAAREAAGQDPEGWEDALSHLDRCPACREAALEVDPLLVFRRLPAPQVSTADVAAMKQGVAAMIRASRVEPARFGGRGPWQRLKWPAAAAALVVASLGLGAPQSTRLAHGWRGAEPKPAVAAPAGAATAELALTNLSPSLEPTSFEGTIEDLSLRDARVYEVASDGFSVVTIVHPSLAW